MSCRRRSRLESNKLSYEIDLITPGRYILTGSVRAELENQVWPGTGRLPQVPMYGMSVREVLGCAGMPPFIDRVIGSGPGGVVAPDDPLTVRDYLDLMLAGSFASVLAVNTAGIPAETTLWSAAGINAKTAQAYRRSSSGCSSST